MRQVHGLMPEKLTVDDVAPLRAEEYKNFLFRFLYDCGMGDNKVQEGHIFVVSEFNFASFVGSNEGEALIPPGAEKAHRYMVVSETMKTSIETVSADGKLFNPFVHVAKVDAGSKDQDRTFEDPSTGLPVCLDDLGWNVQETNESGWAKQDAFLQYMRHFDKETQHLASRKRILIMEGLPTHTSPAINAYAKSKNINIVDLPHLSSHLTNPLDLAFFPMLRVKFFQKFTRTEMSTYDQTKSPELRQKMWQSFYQARNEIGVDLIKKGFAMSGIVPLSPPEFYKQATQRKFKVLGWQETWKGNKKFGV